MVERNIALSDSVPLNLRARGRSDRARRETAAPPAGGKENAPRRCPFLFPVLPRGGGAGFLLRARSTYSENRSTIAADVKVMGPFGITVVCSNVGKKSAATDSWDFTNVLATSAKPSF